jgi:mono/diheme cytochrome c family protein
MRHSTGRLRAVGASAVIGVVLLTACFVAFGLVARLAAAQVASVDDDVRQGHRWAVAICSYCHVASSDQPEDTILRPPAPSFASIAERKDFSEDYLRAFLATTHRAVEAPIGMPNPQLLDFQIKQVAAYILSLRKKP